MTLNFSTQAGRRSAPVLAERDAEAAHLSDYLLLLGAGTISFSLVSLCVMKLLGAF